MRPNSSCGDFLASVMPKPWNHWFFYNKNNNSWRSWPCFGTDFSNLCGPKLQLDRHMFSDFGAPYGQLASVPLRILVTAAQPLDGIFLWNTPTCWLLLPFFLLLLLFTYPNVELWTEERDIGTICPKLGTNRRTDGQKKLSLERSFSVKNLLRPTRAPKIAR